MISDKGSAARARGSGRWAAAVLGAILLALGNAPLAFAASEAREAFASPAQAADALAAAWRAGRSADLLKIFGPSGLPLVRSGDPVADKQARLGLAAAYEEGHGIDGEGPGKAVLVLGQAEWPYPIPLVKEGDKWRFDVEAGAQRIIDRRIGANEMQAIDTARAYVQAQRDYAAKLVAGGRRREYAQKIASSAGRRDGLYWPADGGDESPLGPRVAAAEAQGYGPPSDSGRQPFHGYVFRVLTGQGPAAPGGARTYVADGHMTGGFALIAFPVKYGDSGIMTFIVNQHGIVFEKNLGSRTDAIARGVTAYDPDRTWKIVEP